MTLIELAEVICCEGKPCMKPEACDKAREYRVPVSPMKAAEAVSRLVCREWAQHRSAGPMSVTRVLEGGMNSGAIPKREQRPARAAGCSNESEE
ncbi:hypothetical protein UFOVP504_29 [uncultured Caudovirales phage]|uniref:Uncharacterized protein n=1 Tax=uncultured Caudovirales phage TaxID=2100421 RepID=A0A6J5R0W7_9CAUD|nr:hypothetical protein UFOVP504_29 [uncultured Caudovirales phage]CAB4178028.1 hypothetical protein UFOVP1011_21 [uncultured Caudovirales phage]CAB4187118.1 hypothetical protein UFOVP1162_43 [uncultured Caudovirales phage]CAB4218887.1 hypothetical protein UFOVP1611_46 [uncultured Caudovirales phage]